MKAKAYFPALTGVRGFAAFLIFLDHFNQTSFHPLLFRVFNEFHFPLSMFFVLSGFLICLRYYDTVELKSTWVRKYIKNRIARVYPIYLILTVFTFATAWLLNDKVIYNGIPHEFSVFLMNISFLRGFFDDMKFTGIGQGWSLTVEECFYFTAPLFFLALHRSKKAFVWIPLAFLAVGAGLVLAFGKVDFFGFFRDYKFMFIYTFFGRATEFFVGMGLALIIRKSDESISHQSWFTWLGLLGIAATTVIMVNQPIDEKTPFGLYQPMGIFTNNFLLPFAIAVFYYGLIKEKSVLRRLLSTSFGELFGRSSYIFYLIHLGYISKFGAHHIENGTNFFFEWLDAHEYWWLSEHLSYPVIILTALFVYLTTISVVLYKYVEEPLNLYIRNSGFLEKKKSGWVKNKDTALDQ